MSYFVGSYGIQSLPSGKLEATVSTCKMLDVAVLSYYNAEYSRIGRSHDGTTDT